MRTQIVMVSLLALIVGQVIGIWLFADERSSAIQAALGAETAGRAANVAGLIENAPFALHEQIVEAANSPLVRFQINDNPGVVAGGQNSDPEIVSRIRALMGDVFSRAIHAEVHEIKSSVLPVPNLTPEMAEMHAEMMRGTLSAVELEISISLSGGRWLNVSTRFERPPLQMTTASMMSFLITAATVAMLVFWFVIYRLTRPLVALTQAFNVFGNGMVGNPLVAKGPREVRELTLAFNSMQERLSRFVNDRTMMLAAMAHDIRSPITALRINAELVEDEETQAALIKSLDEMTTMAEATMAYAKGSGQPETLSTISVHDLVRRSGGKIDASIDASPDILVKVRVLAMIRALRNLIENAERYGENVCIDWGVCSGDVEIRIEDSGPGIAETELLHVFDPFVRLEPSRSKSTGGTGLGLSIAKSIVLLHGGSLFLQNRPDGGLSATIKLPLEQTD